MPGARGELAWAACLQERLRSSPARTEVQQGPRARGLRSMRPWLGPLPSAALGCTAARGRPPRPEPQKRGPNCKPSPSAGTTALAPGLGKRLRAPLHELQPPPCHLEAVLTQDLLELRQLLPLELCHDPTHPRAMFSLPRGGGRRWSLHTTAILPKLHPGPLPRGTIGAAAIAFNGLPSLDKLHIGLLWLFAREDADGSSQQCSTAGKVAVADGGCTDAAECGECLPRECVLELSAEPQEQTRGAWVASLDRDPAVQLDCRVLTTQDVLGPEATKDCHMPILQACRAVEVPRTTASLQIAIEPPCGA
mmetsp:Transcript_80991/g.262370  ORF Transcript_80991/g.262370 Transcript_80991/m.262370 type:complete len:307 (+) Transcript_80991:608-1528(+)